MANVDHLAYSGRVYCPPAFREDRLPVLHGAIRAHPLATLVTSGSSGLIANLVPFSLQVGARGAVLRAHIAKANDQLSDLRQAPPTLVIFQGPQAYVSPSWYATKHEHGRVVPTWNYIVVQVRGQPVVIDDDQWLSAQLDELTSEHEQGRAEPWSPSDAPADFIAGQLKGIVGLEIAIEHIDGKWKASQNQPMLNRIGVEQGLRNDGADRMADIVAATANKN
ncbi:FMN-binding negative transcriptional regulator [Rhizorhabdus sp. FW153]|uniref:FMN-binding negative transcriptional regulator n=1 Tax=Rhizorhabdus sp. FW153 TaxID=3400216 RepID=UPI003CEEF0A0